MPIDFRCSQCGKLLRTGDDTAGRQAQCPECGALTQVPGPAETEKPQVAPLLPVGSEIPASPGPAPGTPFGPGPEASGARGPESLYQSPGSYAYQVPPGPADAFAAQRVSGPENALIVTAILGIGLQAIGILYAVVMMGVGPQAPGRGPEAFPLIFSAGFQVATGIIGLALAVVVLLGAMKMKSLENYSFAMASAIIAVIPCTSPCCCLLGIPFGIWALVVLNDGSVKAAFRS